MLTLDEFFSLGDVVIDSETGCAVWGKTKFASGYGRYLNKRAHRLSYEIAFGEIPSTLLVLHKCDVRPCVNPEHLWVGTQVDNMRDMIRKGRKVTLRGEDSYFSSEEYRLKVSGDRHWTKRLPERIAKGDRHWSKLHPEQFSDMSKGGKFQAIKETKMETMKGKSDGQ